MNNDQRRKHIASLNAGYLHWKEQRFVPSSTGYSFGCRTANEGMSFLEGITVCAMQPSLRFHYSPTHTISRSPMHPGMLRSPEFRFPVTRGGPERALRCSANQNFLYLGAVLIQRLSLQHWRGAVHDCTVPTLRAVVPAPPDGASTHGEHLRPRRAL
ncbi:hypothetical protein BGY98DRAFT_363740 [Russula aff. rugulosa BPL654]|nr:hypothetical protein BGY98DRAFT_363740 [Russula aff. rugulosa BPL654]